VEQQLAMRRDVLAAFGAAPGVVEELLQYNENVFNHSAIDVSHWPLPDESFVPIWRQYARETEEAGSLLPLCKYLVQLQFPIQANISNSADYIGATRRGLGTHGMHLATGLSLREPGMCRILVHPTTAGHMPLIVAEMREDFVALVRALAGRNEPCPVPGSMGACMVAGYNNWHRISILRERFHASAPAHDSWGQKFAKIKTQKELYQDRFIILSSGPYSGVTAEDMGLEPEEWTGLSLVIRREHECTHYFTRRVFASMRNNLLDELIADYVGIAAAAGRFHADWLLRFLGLESDSRYREGGRLQNYRGAPPLSDSAFAVLQRLVVAAAANLEDFDLRYIAGLQRSQVQPALLKAMSLLTVEEMACPQAPQILGDSLDAALKKMNIGDRVIAGAQETEGRKLASPNGCQRFG